MLTSGQVGTVQFPSPKAVTVIYEPDGTGGAEYHASAAAGTGTGTLTFKQDGSGSVDIVLPFTAGSAGSFQGATEHITGTWTC